MSDAETDQRKAPLLAMESVLRVGLSLLTQVTAFNIKLGVHTGVAYWFRDINRHLAQNSLRDKAVNAAESNCLNFGAVL